MEDGASDFGDEMSVANLDLERETRNVEQMTSEVDNGPIGSAPHAQLVRAGTEISWNDVEFTLQIKDTPELESATPTLDVRGH